MDKSTGQKRVKESINLRKLPYSFSNQAGAHAYSCLVPPCSKDKFKLSSYHFQTIAKQMDGKTTRPVTGQNSLPVETLANSVHTVQMPQTRRLNRVCTVCSQELYANHSKSKNIH